TAPGPVRVLFCPFRRALAVPAGRRCGGKRVGASAMNELDVVELLRMVEEDAMGAGGPSVRE
ncbi:hypothetical protein AB0K09_27845, partial [Streptomyces sp. NPDC049577]|uniref:hypothetical protein n=1 Tax=Streptomyces sp. NPDC049577 TaxID=3155153 RepID=UPI0034356724